MASRIRAPELPATAPWLNTDRPLSLSELRGRILLLDFWTYCCINCLHVLPSLKYLERKYKDSLTVIGVHSAKFDNEKAVENVRQAILRHDIEHPVLVDSGFNVWNQYAVRAWPTLVLVDPQGYYVGRVAGEGHQDLLEETIAGMVKESVATGAIAFGELSVTLEKHRQNETTPLLFPGKVLADGEGDRLFVADSGHHRLVVTNLEGNESQTIGCGIPGFQDGFFESARFRSPQGMALDAQKQLLYVADTENHALRKIDLQRQTVTTIAGTGSKSNRRQPHSGSARLTALNSPWDLVKIGDMLLVAMAGSHQIWGMDLVSEIIGTYAGTGYETCVDGDLGRSGFAQPSGIATNGLEVFVADSEISSIRGVGLHKGATVRTICGSGDPFEFGDRDGTGDRALLQHCLGVEYGDGYLWVADTYNHNIDRVDLQTGECKTLCGAGATGNTDGNCTQARFYEPSGLSLADGILYIADTNNHAIRRISLETLEVTTIAFPGLAAPSVCIPVS